MMAPAPVRALAAVAYLGFLAAGVVWARYEGAKGLWRPGRK
jgi:hypothetical protein